MKNILMGLSVMLAIFAMKQGNYLLIVYWVLVYIYWLFNYLEGKK